MTPTAMALRNKDSNVPSIIFFFIYKKVPSIGNKKKELLISGKVELANSLAYLVKLENERIRQTRN